MRKQKEKITTIIFALALVVVLILALAIWHNTPVTTSILSTTVPTETPETSNPTFIPTIEIEETQTPSITPEPIETVPPKGEGKVLHSGSYKKTKWKIYKNGLLEVKGTGNMYPKVKLYYEGNVALNETGTVFSLKKLPYDDTCRYFDYEGAQIEPSTGPGWNKYKDEIKSARIEVKGATDLSYLFFRSKIESVDMSKLDTSKVTNMRGMFSHCENLTQLDLKKLNTWKVTDMGKMFYGCCRLEKLNINKLDTSKVTDMRGMFACCCDLKSIDVSKLDTSNAKNMYGMFAGCKSLKSIDISNMDTSRVTCMSWMFSGCKNLTTVDLGKLDISHMEDMQGVFAACRNLTSIDMSKMDISGLTRDVQDMFGGDSSMKKVVTPKRADGDGAIFLPDGVWKDSKGNTYTYIWHNVTKSITLTKE